MLIATDQFEKGLQTAHFRIGLVSMPLQIGPHPEHTPTILCPNKSRLCDGVLHFLFRILPIRPDLEELDAVARNSVAEVELWTNVRRRAMALHKVRKIAFDTLSLDIVECHDWATNSDA